MCSLLAINNNQHVYCTKYYDIKAINDKSDYHHIRVNKIMKFYKSLILFARHATVVNGSNPEKSMCL